VFRIRRIYDDILPVNKEAIGQVQSILRTQFWGVAEEEIAALPNHLRNPLKYRFRSILFVADDQHGRVKGFALLNHAADLNFCFLDFISAAPQKTGGGIGSILYERVREASVHFGVIGLFFECLPDDPALCKDEGTRKQNAARLRFYERYGARPVCNTAYETPLKPEDECAPYLVFDGLGQKISLRRETARAIVQAILERKYGNICPKGYIDMVVSSFGDDPVRLREPRYIKDKAPEPVPFIHAKEIKIALVVNDRHHIHHVHERGYVESPVRVQSILKEIEPTGLFERFPPRRFSEKHILAVHDSGFVTYLKRVCANVPPDKSIYPYVFPIRNAARPPVELPIRAGYYCIDTFTPLNQNAFVAAKMAVDCTLTAAERILTGHDLAYALVRPPGHHAESNVFGGFCYFNSASIAAHYLSRYGKVAILDIDYHHGNGHQIIFYKRSDVLTISIHGHPRFAYPYFSGFADEVGEGAGKGFNINYPLQEHLDGQQYRAVLEKALKKIRTFEPQFIIVALGFDTAKGDPTGTWSLGAKDFEANGKMIGAMGFRTLVVQEGGYRVRSLGINARHFFTGMWQGFHAGHNA
jgi:acetoin utilization deacetylase AcuC-like enzyme/GNAT superfamily N-acetyltransferase